MHSKSTCTDQLAFRVVGSFTLICKADFFMFDIVAFDLKLLM